MLGIEKCNMNVLHFLKRFLKNTMWMHFVFQTAWHEYISFFKKHNMNALHFQKRNMKDLGFKKHKAFMLRILKMQCEHSFQSH